MNASHDRRGYPNIDARVFWLAQVSEAATGFAGTRVPDQFNASTALSKVSFEPVLDAKIRSLSVRREDSFDPNGPLESSHVPRNLRFAKVGGLLMIFALTAGVVASQSMVPDIRQQLVTDSIRVVQAWSSSALGAMPIGSAKPRPIVQQSRAPSGGLAPRDLTLDRPADGAVVHIEGLARGMELSAGKAVGLDGWEVPANDVRDSSALGAASIGRTKPRLIVQQSRAARGEPAPLGLTLDGPADVAVLHIEGLAHGMELSAGRPAGGGWELPANHLDYAWIAPPEGFAGSIDLVAELRSPDGEVADRRTITLEWASPIAPVPVVRQLTESTTLASISPKPVQLGDDQNHRTDAALSESRTTPQSAVGGEEPRVPPISLAPILLQPDREEAVPPEAQVPVPLEARWKEIGAASSTLLEPIQLRPDRTEMMPTELSEPPSQRQPLSEPASQRQPNSEELAVLLKRGVDLIATGDLVAARLVLRRAAEANNAEAALALGATYDPLVLRQLKVYGFTPDAAMARSWYEKAVELGSAAAPRRLEMLTERMGTR